MTQREDRDNIPQSVTAELPIHTTDDPTPPQGLGAPFWMAMLNRPQNREHHYFHNFWAHAFLTLAVVCVMVEIAVVYRAIGDAAKAQESPLEFVAPWRPQKRTYRSGEAVSFTWEMRVKRLGFVYIAMDSWQRETTGELYPNPPVPRYLETANPGYVRAHSVRFLPERIVPGRYKLVGWIQSEAERRTRPVLYESEVIEVKANE